MKIRFRKLSVHNFLSFEDQIFDFSKDRGMNLVYGCNKDAFKNSNGSGKSNTFLALVYGLFGEFPNKVKNENIANKYLDDKNVKVEIELDVDGVPYRLVTSQNKRGQSSFDLFKQEEDGTEIDLCKSSIDETRKFFEEEILKCDMSLFLRTVMLTSEQSYNFFKLKKADKKEFIEKLFDIGVFGEMAERIHKDILKADKRINSIQSALVVLDKSKDEYESAISSWESESKSRKAEIFRQLKEAEEKLESFSGDKETKSSEKLVEESNKKIDEFNEREDKLLSEISQIEFDIRGIANDIGRCKKDISDCKDNIKKHKLLVGKLCKDCKSLYVKHYDLLSFVNKAKEAEKKITQLEKYEKEYKAKLVSLKKELKEIKENTGKERSNLVEITKKLNAIKAEKSNLEAEVFRLKCQTESAEDKENPYVKLLEKTKEDIDDYQKQLAEEEDSYKYMKLGEEIVSQDTIKKFVIRDLVGLLNSRIKSYLSKMGVTYTCVFDDDMNYEFLTTGGKYQFENFSQGEQKRLEIAASLSFCDFLKMRNNISCNILIIDEYIDSALDDSAIDSILTMLKERTDQEKQSIYVITQRVNFMDYFDSRIKVIKENNITHLEFS